MSRYLLLLALISQASNVFSDTNFRLNTPLRPKAYFIAITPYFDTNDENAFTFLGEVEITFTTTAVTKQIKLHSEDLEFEARNIEVVYGLNVLPLNETNPVVFDSKYTFVYINLRDDLQIEAEYTLLITYRGPIRSDLNGFYRNYYIENGVKKWLGATQMEPTHARKVFPCFDEPEYKATFSLSIDRPESYSDSLANTKRQTSIELADGYVREIFYPTPVMSTYLVAFMVSEFKGITNNQTNEFGIYTRPEALNQTSYAIEVGEKVVEALGNYFGIDYYSTNEHIKLDHVALPDFRAGAMENWGLVKYRESLLLYVPEHSTPYYKYRVAQIVAHETTHMWFGNLVTCHWWSDTWLNEGFANYFQDYITITVDPSVASAHALVTGSVYAAYDADGSPSAPAITNSNVNSPSEISGHFGTVTYQKAGSVIRMMHHLIGDAGFKIGLNNYLQDNKFSVGYPEKMYAALGVGVQNTSAFSSYPNTDIAEIMSSWISQAGHPLLHVAVDYATGRVVLTQKRYYSNSSHESEEIYKIPITYTTGVNTSFTNTKPAFIMKNHTHEITIDALSTEHTWVIFNIQETGLYRVNYDEHTWEHIIAALKGSDREKIHHLNRAKIVNDMFALLYADEADFHLLHDVLQFMSSETDYSVWYATIRGLNRLWNMYQGSDALADIQAYALKIVQYGINIVGYVPAAIDDYETLRNRMQILEFACKLGHQGCIDHVVELFRGLRVNGAEITPSLREAAYCNGLRFGNGEDYEFLWSRMERTNVASEARVIGDVLGCTSDENKLKSYLVSMQKENSPIRTQDLTVPLSSVLSNYSHLPLVMNELRGNYTLWSTIYPTMETVLSTVGAALHTEADFAEFEEFLSSCTGCTEAAKTAGRSSMGQARATFSWAEGHKAFILSYLRSSSAIATPSMFLVVTLAVILESWLIF